MKRAGTFAFAALFLAACILPTPTVVPAFVGFLALILLGAFLVAVAFLWAEAVRK